MLPERDVLGDGLAWWLRAFTSSEINDQMAPTSVSFPRRLADPGSRPAPAPQRGETERAMGTEGALLRQSPCRVSSSSAIATSFSRGCGAAPAIPSPLPPPSGLKLHVFSQALNCIARAMEREQGCLRRQVRVRVLREGTSARVALLRAPREPGMTHDNGMHGVVAASDVSVMRRQ